MVLKHLLVVLLIVVNLAVTWFLIGLIGAGAGWQVGLIMMALYGLSSWAMFAALQLFWGFPGT